MRSHDHGARLPALPALVLFVAAACGSGAGAAPAAGPPAAPPPPPLRLPPNVSYELVVGPDRAVVFSHETHVPLAGNKCTACHPQTFRILSPTKQIAHAAMDAGGSCGSCHDGRQAFGVRDSTACASCHTGRRTIAPAAGASPSGSVASRGPAPITYAHSKASPGPVTFRHAAHVEKKLACASCHPRLFAMKVAEARTVPLHDASACGACHDGAKAFAIEDAASCARCHATGGAP
jgi:c(7)-type cytochrome triheme protein